MDLKQHIKNIPDYPKPGIQFKDINSLLANPEAFKFCIQSLAEILRKEKVDIIAGIESRGFIFGAPLAIELSCSFIPIRKKGKLPGPCISQSYQLEYGEDQLEVQIDSVQPGQKVVIVDDLLATGGTLEASILLLRKLNANISSCACIIVLDSLGGEQRLKKNSVPFHSLVRY